jgi:hypothetical protein
MSLFASAALLLCAALLCRSGEDSLLLTGRMLEQLDNHTMIPNAAIQFFAIRFLAMSVPLCGGIFSGKTTAGDPAAGCAKIEDNS